MVDLLQRTADPVMELVPGKPGETLSEILYRTLLEHIMFGAFAKVPRLYPGELAKLFNVSPTPIREALTRLAADGYIELIPRHGYHVRRLAPGHVRDTWAVRQGLDLTAGEIVIARLASGAIRHADFDPMLEILDRLDTETMDHRRHGELNYAFHRAIVELSANRMLIGIYESVQLHVLRAWVQRGSRGSLDRVSTESEEHRAIIGALMAGDLAGYVDATRGHLSRSLRDNLTDLGSQEARNG